MEQGGTKLEQIAAQAVAEVRPVSTEEVTAVNKKENRELYQKREKIHPKIAHGTFRKIKWAALIVLLAIYYLAPWLRWDRGEGVPDQAILVDFANRRFYFFFIEFWPQEIYYVTGLLILASFGLFLVTSVAGRVWCGFACPQTVWTDLFIYVERLFEGDRAARIRMDKKPWGLDKILRRGGKHIAWLIIAAATGGAWVFYFVDAPVLAEQLLTLQASAVNYFIIAGLTFTTYWLGGHMREQVCTYMCPWPRIQGAMLDEESLVVTYHAYRGEPRGAMKKGKIVEGRGDCVDCNQCVAVCPMGIDIRDGQQLECIGCGLCIDACNEVMAKVGRPKNLIAYDTLPNVERRARGEATRLKVVRARTIIYVVLMALVVGFMALQFTTRSNLEVNLIRDRNPLFVELSDGSIRNGFTLKLQNETHGARRFEISLEGLPGAMLLQAGEEDAVAPVLTLSVEADAVGAFRLFVIVPRSSLTSDATDFVFQIEEVGAELETSHDAVFRGP